jgi:hypothetical protein
VVETLFAATVSLEPQERVLGTKSKPLNSLVVFWIFKPSNKGLKYDFAGHAVHHPVSIFEEDGENIILRERSRGFISALD